MDTSTSAVNEMVASLNSVASVMRLLPVQLK